MLLISYGTRPEYIKILPILKELKLNNIHYKLLFTGQHQDIVKKEDCEVITIKDGENRLDSILQSLMNLDFKGVTHSVVQGDTTSALAIAIASFHRNIPVIHVEAGLRTYDIDNPYPEEFNRQTISKIAKYHFCPTEMNKISLVNERTQGVIYVVGNTVLDNLIDHKNKITYSNEILITLHRRENHSLIFDYFNKINQLAKQYKELIFTIPLHPNPNVQKHKDILTDIKVIAPLPYENMIKLISSCKFIISDSGGIQEEASFLSKKVIVCRKETERQETLGITSFLCKHPKELFELFNEINNNYIPIEHICPYGDGKSAKKIVYYLAKEIIK